MAKFSGSGFASGIGQGLAQTGLLVAGNALAGERDEAQFSRQKQLAGQMAELDTARQEALVRLRATLDTERQTQNQEFLSGQEKSRQAFEAGEPSRKARGEVETARGLIDLASEKGIPLSGVPGAGVKSDKDFDASKYIKTFEKDTFDQFGNKTGSETWVEIKSPDGRVIIEPYATYQKRVAAINDQKDGVTDSNSDYAPPSPDAMTRQPAAAAPKEKKPDRIREANENMLTTLAKTDPTYAALLRKRSTLEADLRKLRAGRDPQKMSRMTRDRIASVERALEQIKAQIQQTNQRP